MSDFKVEFVKDFFNEYPDKDVLRGFIINLPLNKQDKNFLIKKYCEEKVNKVIAYELGYSERYIKAIHKEIIIKTLPFVNLFFIKALNTSLSQPD